MSALSARWLLFISYFVCTEYRAEYEIKRDIRLFMLLYYIFYKYS